MGSNSSKARHNVKSSDEANQNNINNNNRNKKPIDLSVLNTRVDCVTINGLCRTKDDYIQRSIQNLFKTKNFQEILYATKTSLDNLHELGIFGNVKVLIDTSKGESASPNGYEVVFDGKELSRITGTIGTTVDNNEGALTVELTTPNVFGRGEQISINGSYSTKKTNDINLRFWKGFHHTNLGDYKPETSVTLFKHTAFYPWSKYRLNSFGVLFDFQTNIFKDIKQNIQYEIGVKEIMPIGKKDIPFFVREQSGPNLSSLFRYILSYDNRDSSIFPTSGSYIKATNELNFYGNSGINHISTNTHAEMNIPLVAGLSIQFVQRCGVIKSLNQKDIGLSDRFILGGPLSLRGFKHAGIGPRDEGCTVGSNMYWASGIHLWSPLPFANPNSKFSQIFKTQLFYNCGNTDKFSLDNYRSSCGVGLAIKLGEKARVELNYCYPLQHHKTDNIEKNFQFGIGYDFL